MANPLKAAVRLASGKKETDLTWDGERGWSTTIVRGNRHSPPMEQFETLVYEGFRRNPVARACVNELASSLAEAPIYPYRPGTEAGEWTRQIGHPAEDLFVQPNERDNYVSFIQRSVQHFFFGGNNYWKVLESGAGRAVGLVPIRPDRVTGCVLDSDDMPIYYKIRRPDSTTVDNVDAELIIHMPDTDPLNEIFGTPRLLSAALELRSDTLASEYVAEVLSNHGSPGLVVGVDPKATPNQLDDAEERWDEKFGRGKGRGRVGFIPGGGMVKEVGFSLQALEFPNLRRLSRESICTIFGVDPMLIGLGSASSSGGTMSGNEYEQAQKRLWMQTLIPLIRLFEAEMNASLAPYFGRVQLFFELDEIMALQESRDKAVERSKKMKEVGVYTVEEIRVNTGHSKTYKDGALVVQTNNTLVIPADELGTEATARPQGGQRVGTDGATGGSAEDREEGSSGVRAGEE